MLFGGELPEVVAAVGHRETETSTAISTISRFNVQGSLPKPIFLIRNLDFL